MQGEPVAIARVYVEQLGPTAECVEEFSRTWPPWSDVAAFREIQLEQRRAQVEDGKKEALVQFSVVTYAQAL